jgi:hypothetical protein
MAVRPEPSAGRRREWDALCAALDAPDYEDLAAAEMRRARSRLNWASDWRPLRRRIEMRLVNCGLVPLAVVGD